MKREPKPVTTSQYVRSLWPWFFWYPCVKCKKEFRREWGWDVLCPPFGKGVERIKHVCGSCASNPFKAKDIAWDPGPRPLVPHNLTSSQIPKKPPKEPTVDFYREGDNKARDAEGRIKE